MASQVMASAFVASPVVCKPRTVRARYATVVRASQSQDSSRRAVLGLGFAAMAAAALSVADKAEATAIPFHESIKNDARSNSSRASAASYIMEGTKKRGISASKKQELMAAAKKLALAAQ